MADSIHFPRTRLWLRREATMIVIPALALLLGCAADSTVAVSADEPTAAIENRNYSFSITPSDRTVHVKFLRVRPSGDESVSAFVERMFASADAAGATRLVVDLSATKGGDSFLLVPLVRGVMQRQQFAKRGGLVVIIGPDSFSPAQNTAAVLERYANPMFVARSVE